MCLEIVHERFFFIFFRDEIRDGGQGRVATRSCEARLAWPSGRKGNEHQCPPIHQRLLFSLAPQRRPQLESRVGPREAGRGASVIAQDDGLPGRMASIARNARGPLLDRDRLRRQRRWRDVFFRSPDEGGCVRIPAELARPPPPPPPTPPSFSLSLLNPVAASVSSSSSPTTSRPAGKFNISVTERNHGLRDLEPKKRDCGRWRGPSSHVTARDGGDGVILGEKPWV